MINIKTIPKPIKIAATSIVSIFVFIILIAVIIQISRIGKIPISVNYAPFSSEVFLNGQKLKNNSTNYISAGDYELSVKLEHFNSITKSISVSSDTKFILGSLTASDEAGEKIAKESQKDYLTVEGLYGYLSNEAGLKIKQDYPILNYLPINNNLYSISYSYNQDSSPKYQNTAVKKLYTLKNVSPTDYDISFTNTPNPFLNPAKTNSTNPSEFITNSFPNIISNYHISSVKTLDEFLITTIYKYNYTNDNSYSSYKVILKKENNELTFAATPELILTTKNTKNIPKNVLDAANKL